MAGQHDNIKTKGQEPMNNLAMPPIIPWGVFSQLKHFIANIIFTICEFKLSLIKSSLIIETFVSSWMRLFLENRLYNQSSVWPNSAIKMGEVWLLLKDFEIQFVQPSFSSQLWSLIYFYSLKKRRSTQNQTHDKICLWFAWGRIKSGSRPWAIRKYARSCRISFLKILSQTWSLY